MLELNNIYCGDARLVMKDIDDESIDMTITSPPYDNLRTYNNPDGSWNFEVFKGIADELYRVTKQGGVVVWVVNDRTVKGSKTLSSFKQALYFQSIGFNVNDVMIWSKTNPCPVVAQPRYTDVFDYMMIFSKGKPKTFNPIMIDCKSAGQLYKSTARNIGGENGRRKVHYHVNDKKVKGNVWECAIARNRTGHPAVYPYDIVLDHIRTWTNEGDIVLDPFIGSGTTALVCMDEKRHYIGIDINEEYCKMTKDRILENSYTLENS